MLSPAALNRQASGKSSAGGDGPLSLSRQSSAAHAPCLSRQQSQFDDLKVAAAPVESAGMSDGDIHRFLLLVHSGHEAQLWFEYMVSCLLSSASVDDLSRLNPFVPRARWHQLRDLLAVLLLRANRVGQTNRTLQLTADTLRLLEKCRADVGGAASAGAAVGSSSPPRALAVRDADASALQLKVDACMVELTAARAYCVKQRGGAAAVGAAGDDTAPSPPPLSSGGGGGGDAEAAATTSSSSSSRVIDPRFLVFEFLWNLVLRPRQVDLVRECVRTVHGHGSLVKQMIMGAGKTTVVSPLISLILAQGSFLVVQCVPPALLEMSSRIFRSTFSSVIQKRLYTFACDRSTPGTKATLEKLRSARDHSSIVITTPPAIKSMFLKFVENLTIVTDRSHRKFDDREIRPETEVWADVLALFRDGVCIIDEVDLVLHPLRSELNYPIGEKKLLAFTKEHERWRLPIALIDAILFAAGHALRGDTSAAFAMPPRLHLAGTVDDTRRVLHAMILAMDDAFATRALQREPHMVLLRDEWYHHGSGSGGGGGGGGSSGRAASRRRRRRRTTTTTRRWTGRRSGGNAAATRRPAAASAGAPSSASSPPSPRRRRDPPW